MHTKEKTMCRIEKILRTQQTTLPPISKQEEGKSMSVNQIRYNTDMVFSIAKNLEIPLDVAIDRMKRNGSMRTLNNSYRKRNRVSYSAIVKEISSEIEDV